MEFPIGSSLKSVWYAMFLLLKKTRVSVDKQRFLNKGAGLCRCLCDDYNYQKKEKKK